MRFFGRLLEIVDVNDLNPTARRQVEKLDYFSDPAYVGKAIPFACRTEGDRFYQSGTVPGFEGGKKVRDIKLRAHVVRRRVWVSLGAGDTVDGSAMSGVRT